MKGRLVRIHVNQHVIRDNKSRGEDKPVITVKSSTGNTYAHEVAILDSEGVEVARIVYRPEKPLSCGARVWIETRNEVRLERRDEKE